MNKGPTDLQALTTGLIGNWFSFYLIACLQYFLEGE